jgi:uncharacterized protein (DUF362 family)/Pyruvate/2-oxoacid:ferredoxin oxidoreductase delta subunit
MWPDGWTITMSLWWLPSGFIEFSSGEKMPTSVAIVRCSSYDQVPVRQAVRRAFDLIGGLGMVIKAGDRVLIKPNLLTARTPDRATTTHPEVVTAVIESVQAMGGRPVIGDSPGSTRGDIETLWSETGMRDVSERTGAPLVNFEASGVYRTTLNGQVYYIAKTAMDVDLIVNMPKLKTHSLTLFTGAVKNMFGVVPGFRKRETHLLHPKAEPFCRALVDIFSLVVPRITLMDAVEAMDGDGPAAGRKRHIGLLLAGGDAVAVDATAGMIVGMEPEKIHTCRLAAQRGLGVVDPADIRLLGDDHQEMGIEPFARPRSDLTRMVPTPLIRLLRRFIYTRPRILPERCTNCNTCVRHCPTQALVEDRPTPRFEARRCISCLCCHELCPESAIELKWSLMARLAP